MSVLDVELPPGYPTQWEADVVMKDGTVAHLRPIKPSDADALQEFHSKQSEESIYLRFFAPLKRLSQRDLHRFTHVDYVDRVALVVTMRDDIIGIGRYDRVDETSAEIAFNVSDHYQGKGIGSVLLEHLAAVAQEFGITLFTAEVLPQNRKMLMVFAEAGYEVKRRIEDGIVAVSFAIEPTERSKAVAMSREHRSEATSVRAVLHPKVVAVVGASRQELSVGHHILANLVAGHFAGRVHPVNPNASSVAGLTAYPSVSAIPERVDLVVIAVPRDAVLGVVDDCAEAGVSAIVVVSSGFAEVDDEGTELQGELVRRARSAGMRVLGPNTFGIINNHPDVQLNASFAPTLPPPGHLGLFAQSGALGIAVLASASRRRLGISTFASSGNRVDVSGNDFMQYWIDDDDTKAVGLYIEAMGNPRKFSRIARKLALAKPVIVVKPGFNGQWSPSGQRVRQTRVRPEVFDAMLRQAGVIRADNVHQLFDVAQLVLHQPLPAGDRVAIVANSDAIGTLTAEACAGQGLSVTASLAVPSEADTDEFRRALDTAFADPAVDSVLAVFIPPLITYDEEVAIAIREAAEDSDKPCLATFLGMRGVSDGHSSVSGTGEGRDQAIPVYGTPEDAVWALAAATRYAEWRGRDHGEEIAPTGVNRRIAEDIVETILSVTPEGRRLGSDEAASLLKAYGVDVWPVRHVDTVEEAVAAADDLGWPVVLKSTAPMLRHLGEVSSVRVGLATEPALREAWQSLSAHLAPLAADQFAVQSMASQGVACVVTSDEDPLFGPVIGFSVAGLPTELLGDIAYRIPPLTDVNVSALLSSIKAAPLLHGYRGTTPVDRSALVDLIGRIGKLADDMPEIASLRLNPVMAHAGGVEVLGADITIAPAPRRIDPGRRVLA